MTPFASALRAFSGGRVLDVATGAGQFIEVLTTQLPDYAEIIGVDSAERPLAAARAACTQPNLRFLLMRTEQLEFPDASFDTVCISNSLHHLAARPQALAEMGRVLKPGGHFILSEMYRDGQTEPQLTHVYLHHWWAAIDTANGLRHDETFTRQQVVEIATGLGLRDLALHDYADLEADPLDPEGVAQLEGHIDTYLQRAANIPGAAGTPLAAALRARGEELRQRLRTVGFHSATTLLAIGVK